MAIVEDLLTSEAAKGLAIGLGAVLLAPVALATLGGIGKPVARAFIKSGIIVYEKGRETLAEFGEVVEDLVAEAQAELRQTPGAAPSATPNAPTPGAEATPPESDTPQ